MSGVLRVGIVGCGLIGRKRAEALDAECELVGCVDVSADAADAFARDFDIDALSLEALLDRAPDVVVVAVVHDQLAGVATSALRAGAHVLVEKPAAISVAQVEALQAAAREAGRLVKVGFNHRFHPGIMRAAEEARSGAYGDVLHVRGRYGHGGRIGYDREWRADPARSGGGELVDQGMHLLDLTHWIAGELPLHSALLRTHFWATEVDDNAVLVLGDGGARTGPWAMLHATWTEWKNMFSLEVYCRTAKLRVEGLTRSYGPQKLWIHRMSPELGPPETEEIAYPDGDPSWTAEWAHFAAAIRSGDPAAPLLGDLDDARYAWGIVEAAYAASAPYRGVPAAARS